MYGVCVIFIMWTHYHPAVRAVGMTLRVKRFRSAEKKEVSRLSRARHRRERHRQLATRPSISVAAAILTARVAEISRRRVSRLLTPIVVF